MKIKKFFIVTHFLLFLIFSLATVKTGIFYWSLLAANLVLFFVSYKIISLRLHKDFLRYLVLPILFINSCFLYSSLLINRFLVFVFLLSSVLLLFYYYRSAVKYYFIESDRKKNLPFWSNLFGFLTVFFAGSFIYGLPYFIKINSWFMVLALSLVLFVSFFQNVSVEKSSLKNNLFFSTLFLFSVVPLLWSLLFLPFNYNVSALIVSLLYYSSLTLSVAYCKKDLTLKKIRYNLIFVFIMLLLVSLSAKWK